MLNSSKRSVHLPKLTCTLKGKTDKAFEVLGIDAYSERLLIDVLGDGNPLWIGKRAVILRDSEGNIIKTLKLELK